MQRAMASHRGAIDEGFVVVTRLSRIGVVAAVLFVTADAGMCSYQCLLDDTATNSTHSNPIGDALSGVPALVPNSVSRDCRYRSSAARVLILLRAPTQELSAAPSLMARRAVTIDPLTTVLENERDRLQPRP